MPDTILPRLDAARRDLLDLGLRNALVNHGTRARQVRVVDERAQEIYRTLVKDGRAMVFDPLAAETASTAVKATGDAAARLEELDWNTLLAQPEDGGDTPAQRHTDNHLQTALGSEALHTRLLSIHNDARGYIEEQGVNILFLALGFLHWYEAGASSQERRAPLLLIPVELERASASERFSVRWTQGDISDNLSLVEKLRTEFNLKLPLMGDQEEFDPGVWFAQVARAIEGTARWKVEPDEVTLGFFSFGKFLMYADLDPKVWAGLDVPPILASLVDGGFREPESPFTSEAHIDQMLQPADVRQVRDADSSQVLAILDVMRGRNLVLQGPPGTGKSQTITNIIAESIGAGKKVLFVAEKMAALDVVKRRLDECGLGDAVLELHSHKTSKKQLLDELSRTLHQGKPVAERIEDDIAELTRLRDELNAYCEAVNTPIGNTRQSFVTALGWSIKSDCGPEVGERFPYEPMKAWTDADFRQQRNLVETMDRHLASAGAPADSPFRDTTLQEFLPSQRDSLLRELQQARDLISGLIACADTLASEMSLPRATRSAEAALLSRAARRAMEAPHLEGVTLRSGEWQLRRDELAQLLAAGRALSEAHARLDGQLIDSAWEQDLVDTRRVWVTKGDRWWRFLSGEFRAAQARMRGLARGSLPTEASAVVTIIDTILDSQRQRTLFGQHVALGRALFGAQWKDLRSDWDVLDTLTQWVIALYRDVGDGSIPEGLIQFLSGSPAVDRLRGTVDQLDDLLTRCDPALGGIAARLALPTPADGSGPVGVDLASQLRAVDGWISGIDVLDERVRFNVIAAELAMGGLGCVAERAFAWRHAPGTLTRLFDNSWYTGLVELGYQQSAPIRQFDRVQHELRRERFGSLDQLLFRHNQVRLALAHWQKLPSQSSGGEMAVLSGEMHKKRRHLPIRTLMEKAGRAIQAIKPVFMMGPMSVAAYVPPGSVAFDLVVFDEASQVKPVDAFGALMRARQAVVVGDSKQLPPTSFFDSVTRGEESTEAEEGTTASVGDMESILSLFLGRGAPERMLRWHYRSQHHSLIAVSNHEFYGSELVVFPSPGGSTRARGLRLRHHPDTVYDRGNTSTNPGEAKHVAEAVMQHARENPDLTLGVVAFSVAQRDAIELQLERLRRADGSLEPFFSLDRREPFFVKNLENVQGDERDMIFISVGYGRAEGGYMPMSFGPLNREGGERRLNVLISRSRLAMDVFCNFRADDLDLARTNARAVASLKNFLAYAERGELSTPRATGREPDSPFEQSVIRALQGRGYTVHPQVGSAGFFIDIGVLDPDAPGRYLIGIECDGAAYHSSRSARDRDRLRQSVLEGLGWRMHRIWSTDWYRNPGKELDRTVAAIERAKALAPPQTPVTPEPQAAVATPDPVPSPAVPVPAVTELPRETVVRAAHSYPAYARADITVPLNGKQLHEIDPEELAKFVVQVVQAESPIHAEEVARRITEAAGLKRTGSRIQDVVAQAAALAVQAKRIARRKDFLWRVDMQDAPVRDRSAVDSNLKKIEYVAPEEIRAALVAEVSRGFSMDVEAAIVAVARVLGFQRVSPAMRQTVLEQVKVLEREGRLNRSGDVLTAAA